MLIFLNPLSANITKWSNTQFLGNLPANYLSVFDHFTGLALKGLIYKVEWRTETLIKTEPLTLF